MDVTLHPLDEPGLAALLAAAVEGAEPAEVMPAEPGASWDDARRTAFLAFHRARSLAADPVERTWVVRVAGVAAGAVRVEPPPGRVAHHVGPDAPAGQGTCHSTGGSEIGLWLGRGFRGRGLGRAAVSAVRDVVAGPLVARTTAGNAAALGLLRTLGAVPEGDGPRGDSPEGAVTARITDGRSWGRPGPGHRTGPTD